VYNDVSEDLVNLFRVLRQPSTATMLQAQLEGTPYSRAEFNLSLKHCDEPLEQARRFIVRQRMSHGGLGKVFAYAVTETNDGKPNVVNRFHTGVARLPLVSARFKNVIVEQSTWQEIFKRYDRPTTCFYLDPPYLGSERVDGGYDHEMDSPAEHQELVEACLAAQSMIVLSGYQSTLYERLEAAGWSRIDIDVPAYTSDKRERRTECLWINPAAQAALAKQRPLEAAKPANSDLFGDLAGDDQTPSPITSAKLAMSHGASISHGLQTDLTEARVIEAIRIRKQSGRKILIQDVALELGITRFQIGRRYKHCFQN